MLADNPTGNLLSEKPSPKIVTPIMTLLRRFLKPYWNVLILKQFTKTIANGQEIIE